MSERCNGFRERRGQISTTVESALLNQSQSVSRLVDFGVRSIRKQCAQVVPILRPIAIVAGEHLKRNEVSADRNRPIESFEKLELFGAGHDLGLYAGRRKEQVDEHRALAFSD